MAKYKRYERYKDSGVEWIGEIPGHWDKTRIKDIALINGKALSENMPEDYEIEYVDISSVNSEGRVSGTKLMNFGSAPSRARRVVSAKDTIVSTVRTYLKAITYFDNPPSNLICSTGFAVLSPQMVNPKFLFRLMHSEPYIREIVKRSVGVSYPAINASEIGHFPCYLPKMEEQQAIANFLDQKTSEIDDLIADKEKLIKLLQEYRQSVISEAVTKGLNPDVKMKDSGVEWIGEIPEHWQVQRLKRSVEGCIGGVWGDEAQGSEEDIICIRVADFNRQQLSILPENLTIRAVPFSQRQKRELNLGDLLIEKSGGGDLQPVGAVVAYDLEKPAVCSNFITRMPVAKGFCYEFLKYLHNAIYAIRLNCRSIKQTTGIQNLDIESYLNERAAFPPLSEQQAIAGYLNRFTSQVDILVEEIKDSIAKLKEFRQSLISEAVTGKIDVREVI